MILILSGSPAECAKMLDDKALSKMISACAQVLCNVHHMKDTKNIPLPLHKTVKANDVLNWTLECLANYRLLLAYARACCDEYAIRFRDVSRDEKGQRITKYNPHEMHNVIAWCEHNQPELLGCKKKGKRACTPDCGPGKCYWDEHTTPFPLVMPDKYQVVLADGKQPYTYDVIESYRKYYRALLKKAGRKRCKECGGYGTFDIREKHPDPIFQCDFCNGKGYTKKAPTFTRHEIPSWLGDL
jgi:hypothetical protein